MRVKIGKAIYLTDFEAMLAGGALGGIVDGWEAAEVMPVGAAEGEYIDGAKRRHAATRGLLDLLLEQFLVDLSKGRRSGVQESRFVPVAECGLIQLQLSETANAVGVDCPRAHGF